MKNTRVGVDLAKDVIQVCIFINNKVLSNTEMTPSEFSLWLINAKPAILLTLAVTGGLTHSEKRVTRKTVHVNCPYSLPNLSPLN